MWKHGKEKPVADAGGIYVAAVTPRRDREVEVDLGAMLELVDFLGGHHVDGIVLFGTTGEFVHYTIDERARYVALLAKRSRVPVMANVSHSTLDGAVLMAEEAAGAGISAVLLMPPHYFRYPPEAVEAFALAFAGHVAKWTKIYLYNIPVFADGYSLDTVERLMATGMFAGIKDSSGEWAMTEGLLRLRSSHQFTILAGNDRLFARARAAGVDGAVSGVACAVPELMMAIDCAVRSGDKDAVSRLDARVGEFIDAIAPFPTPVGIKAAVGLRGVKPGPCAAPMGTTLSAQLEQFKAWFREWLPGVQGECKAG